MRNSRRPVSGIRKNSGHRGDVRNSCEFRYEGTAARRRVYLIPRDRFVQIENDSCHGGPGGEIGGVEIARRTGIADGEQLLRCGVVGGELFLMLLKKV